MAAIWRDILYSFKALINKPGFTIGATLTLIVGIGANTAIFSVVKAVLLKPFPYQDPDRLVFILEKSQEVNAMSVSLPDFYDWRDQNQSFQSMAALRVVSLNLGGTDQPEKLAGAMVTADTFPLLGVSPLAGRVISPNEDRLGGELVVVLSHDLWQRRFGGDRDILGRKLILNGTPHTVIGVMPPRFKFADAEMWIPLGPYTDGLMGRDLRQGLIPFARLKPGVAQGQAQAEMDTIAGRLAQQYPDTNAIVGARVIDFTETAIENIRPLLLLSFVAAGITLLIVCVNIGNLLLARNASREKEIAIRLSLGARRSHIVRILLAEALLIALSSGVIAVLLSFWIVGLLVGLIPAGYIPSESDVKIDVEVFIFALGISLFAALLFGLLPALWSSRPDLNKSLKESSRGLTGRLHIRQGRTWLVISEIALAQLLLIGAGLTARSFFGLLQIDPGFNTENALTMRLSLPKDKYPTATQSIAFYKQLLQKLQELPGVQFAGVTNQVPLSGRGLTSDFHLEGAPRDIQAAHSVSVQMVSPDYFRAMGIELIKGRTFTDRDNEAAQRVVIADESLVNNFFQGQDPIGKRVQFNWGPHNPSGLVQIVGVVRHVRNDDLIASKFMQLYVPLEQPTSYWKEIWPDMCLIVRASGDPTTLSMPVRRQVQSLDPDQPVFEVATLKRIADDEVAQPRLHAYLLSCFAALALVLAVIGAYGVLSYSVGQRTREIGIRMGLGADRRDVFKLVIKQGMGLVVIGIGVGILASLALTRIISSLLFGISVNDPITYTGTTIVLSVVALLACYWPARRASKLDLLVALREE